MQRTRGIVAISLVLIGFGLVGADTALAQEHELAPEPAAAPFVSDASLKAIAASFGAALVVFAGATGIGRIGSSAVEAMARQPETAGAVNTATLITAAMIEGPSLFAVVVCLLTIIL